MPTPKNGASINLNSSLVKSVQILIQEEKPMRFQYVKNKDMKKLLEYQIYSGIAFGGHIFDESRETKKAIAFDVQPLDSESC